MAKPNVPKEIKPKTEDEVKISMDGNKKMVMINIVSTLFICVLFICVNYLLQDNLLTTKLGTVMLPQEDVSEDADEEEVQKGIIVDLGDFIVNLSDVNQKKYLKVNVALELSRIPSDPSLKMPAGEKSGGHGGHGGAATEDPMKMVETEMAQYKPAIRDAVITNLSSKSAAELSTAAGKELAKEQIAEDVNAIFAGTREVMRVSFGQFIIQ